MEQVKRLRYRPLLLLVLLLVNAAAVWGQAGWALGHIVPADWTPNGYGAISLALGFALAIETIGIFLSVSADDAEDRDIPSGGIRLASYAQGFVSGALNFSHWTGAAAIAFGLLSTLSPFLWGINSRVNRSRPIAPSRRFWHPRRSIALIRYMAWKGIALESDGIASMASQGDDRPASKAVMLETILRDENLAAQLQSVSSEERVRPVDEYTITTSDGSTYPVERKPRATPADLRTAVDLLLADKPLLEVSAETGMGASTLRRYARIIRKVRDGHPPVDAETIRKEKVRPEMVEVIREHVAKQSL